jgi:probable selenate reductase FAD-binding subunit
MRAVQRYLRSASLEEALASRAADPSAAWLAGGTFLLAGDGRDKEASVIDLGDCLPRGIVREGDELAIGALATFQEIADSPALPPCLAQAALGMKNRNTRNRATIGGNIGADKSCSSLMPVLLALGAEVEIAAPKTTKLSLEDYLGRHASSALVTRIFLPPWAAKRAAYRRWSRSACDLSILGAAAAFSLEGSVVKGLRVALGGLGPKSRRRPDIEALFEGRALPGREAIEAAVMPLLEPIGDLRGSADFKALRGAQLVAEALIGASASKHGAEEARL